jgi:UDPglucose 6-dehydrogenase
MKPDRVVIGCDSPKALAIMSDLYAPFVRTGNPLILMDMHSSELTKYASNAFLATKVTFMNEVANLCEQVGADVDMVRKGMGADPRIGMQFLFAGVGYGGSCFPKDVSALLNTSRSYDCELKLLASVEDANRRQKMVLVNKMKKHYGTSLKGKIVALWGLAFKPNTDDMREAPSLTIIDALQREGVTIRAYDPEAMEEAKRRLGRTVKFVDNNYDALKGADALLVVTEWSEFRRPDFDRIKLLMKEPVIFDGRNVYDPKVMKEKGFVYYGIGRGR